jgi:protein-L-isoaspartate(D-aspartate) O-methyltransferase
MSIDEVRRNYARQVCQTAQVDSQALVDAFARVPREHFLDPGPWQIAQPFNPSEPYRTTPDARVEHLYEDVLVAIDPARQLNNGQPSAHARWIGAAAPKPGESVLHVGCGVGYYTAILAELVGSKGRVVACEVDPGLAARARTCLADWPQVRVLASDASEPLCPHDVIYVNAGATHARPEWLSALAPGGRLLLPLTVHLPMFPQHGVDFVLCAERRGERWPVRVVSPVGIFDCQGARDEDAATQLRRLLTPDAAARLHALVVEPHAKGGECLYHLDGFCLQA